MSEKDKGKVCNNHVDNKFISPDRANAPYNFINLPDDVLPSELDKYICDRTDQEKVEQGYKDFIKSKKVFSGYIDLEFKTLTPVFIRGDNNYPYTLGERYVLPGSSIRGMIKNIFKIITMGALRPTEDFQDRNLYFRQLMAPNKKFKDGSKEKYQWAIDLNNLYKRILKGTVKQGYLIKDKENYYIVPDSHDFTTNDISDGKEVEIDNYKLDTNRRGKDLLDELKNKSKVRCFYVPSEKKIKLFGHCKKFRVPYNNSVGKIVKRSYKKNVEEIIDYTDAVFGKSPLFASRVFFEDAMSVNKINLMDDFPAHPLLQPNPTSFQFYLKQEFGEPLKNWDSEDAEIRGYKLYWHQSNNGKTDIEASNAEKQLDAGKNDKDKVCPVMRPIPANSIFTSRLRFTNLLPEELGALLMCFDIDSPNKNIAFKLGQGKSLGLGSIKLQNYSLKTETDTAYKTFSQDNVMADTCITVTDTSDFRKSFSDSIPKSQKNNWDHVKGELAAMMDYDNTVIPNWKKKTSTMPASVGSNGKFRPNWRFIDRCVLPTVCEVIGGTKNNKKQPVFRK